MKQQREQQKNSVAFNSLKLLALWLIVLQFPVHIPDSIPPTNRRNFIQAQHLVPSSSLFTFIFFCIRHRQIDSMPGLAWQHAFTFVSPLPSAVTHDPKGDVGKKLRAFCENGLNWLRTNKSAGMSNIEPSISHEIWLGEEVTHGNRLSISIRSIHVFLSIHFIFTLCAKQSLILRL